MSKKHEYFINLAKQIAENSKDPVYKVGAVIVGFKNYTKEENEVISSGYNCFPQGCSDDEFPWSSNKENWLESKHPYVVHAETNAIVNAKQDCGGFVLYTTLFPCNECAKLIIQSGIKEIFYLESFERGYWAESFQAATKMLKSSGVGFTQITVKL